MAENYYCENSIENLWTNSIKLLKSIILLFCLSIWVITSLKQKPYLLIKFYFNCSIVL